MNNDNLHWWLLGGFFAVIILVCVGSSYSEARRAKAFAESCAQKGGEVLRMRDRRVCLKPGTML